MLTKHGTDVQQRQDSYGDASHQCGLKIQHDQRRNAHARQEDDAQRPERRHVRPYPRQAPPRGVYTPLLYHFQGFKTKPFIHEPACCSFTALRTVFCFCKWINNIFIRFIWRKVEWFRTVPVWQTWSTGHRSIRSAASSTPARA